MPDMQQQIDALREAFSADIRKPFVLKPTFPYGSPGAPVHTSPPRANVQYRQGSTHGSQNLEQQHAPQQVSYTAHPISPPISAGGVDNKSDSPAVQSLVMMATGQRAPQPPITSGVPMTDPSTWNPSRIFEYAPSSSSPFQKINETLANGTRLLVRTLLRAPPLLKQPL